MAHFIWGVRRERAAGISTVVPMPCLYRKKALIYDDARFLSLALVADDMEGLLCVCICHSLHCRPALSSELFMHIIYPQCGYFSVIVILFLVQIVEDMQPVRPR